MKKQSLYSQEILIRAIEIAVPRHHYCRLAKPNLLNGDYKFALIHF